VSVRSGAAAAWAMGRRLGGWPEVARERSDDPALRRHLLLAAPVATAFAVLAVLAGAAFQARPSTLGALSVLAAVATGPLLVGGLVRRLLRRLEVAMTEREVFQAELDAAGRTTEELRDLANHDGLTGLPNRSLLYDRLAHAITRSRRQSSHIAVLFLDLDGFKKVNDSLGHGFGDRVLVELASRIRTSVRAGDTVARFGGDEFVVLLDGVSGVPDARRVAAKVVQAVQEPYRFGSEEARIAASVGVGIFPGDGTSCDELLRTADTAMYREKQRATDDGSGSRPTAPRSHGTIGWSDELPGTKPHDRTRGGH